MILWYYAQSRSEIAILLWILQSDNDKLFLGHLSLGTFLYEAKAKVALCFNVS
jgi:hypothetical protein